MRACRTLAHSAMLAGVADRTTEVRREVKRIEAAAALLDLSLKEVTNQILADNP